MVIALCAIAKPVLSVLNAHEMTKGRKFFFLSFVRATLPGGGVQHPYTYPRKGAHDRPK